MKHGYLTAAAAVLAAVTFAAEPAATVHLDFDSDQRGTTPAWLRFDATPGLVAGRWIVQPDAHPQSAPNVLVQGVGKGAAGQYRFAISTGAKAFLDGQIRVALEPKANHELRSAGVVLRYRSPQDFLAVEYDFSSSDIEIFQVRGGKRESLGHARAISPESGWTRIGFSAEAGSLEATVADRKVLDARDLHAEPGEAGLVTEGPTVAAFDELQIERR